MKKSATLNMFITLMMLLVSTLQGCFKDTVSKTYKVLIPVYKTTAEVRSNIKSADPLPLVNPGKMFLYGNYIFVNEVNKGIHIIDNTSPSSPVNKYFINIPGNVDLAVTGNTLYADLYTDMVTLDISDPSSVKVKKIIESAFPHRVYPNNFTSDTSKVILDWIVRDTIVTSDFVVPQKSGALYYTYDISSMSLTASSVTKATTGISGSMARFALLNNYLYTVVDNALNVFNITQPQNPVFSNKIYLGSGIETIYPFKENLFLGSQTGMQIYSVANPQQPAQVGAFSHAQACDPVIADDSFAYITLRAGSACGGTANSLDIVNIKSLPATKFIKSYPLTDPHGLSKDGNTLFVCDGKGGLKVYDASNVYGLILSQSITGIETYDVIASNNIAVVVAKNGLYQYDYTDRSNVKLLSFITYNK